jgi:hypothetical protein
VRWLSIIAAADTREIIMLRRLLLLSLTPMLWLGAQTAAPASVRLAISASPVTRFSLQRRGDTTAQVYGSRDLLPPRPNAKEMLVYSLAANSDVTVTAADDSSIVRIEAMDGDRVTAFAEGRVVSAVNRDGKVVLQATNARGAPPKPPGRVH